MYCRQCGQMLNSNQMFCPNCGTRVEQGQIVDNNNMYGQNKYQQHKNVRYHWEYGCLCIFIFWVPYFITAIISLFADTSVLQSSLYKTFSSICVFIGLCTVPVFVIEAIVYSIKVKKNR